MTAAILMERTEKVRIKKIAGKEVAVLPRAVWEDIEDYLEDIAMSQSRTLAARIKKARESGKFYTMEEVKKHLGL